MVVMDVGTAVVGLVAWCVLVAITVERIVDVGLTLQSEADEYLELSQRHKEAVNDLSGEVRDAVAKDDENRQSFRSDLDDVERELNRITTADSEKYDGLEVDAVPPN